MATLLVITVLLPLVGERVLFLSPRLDDRTAAPLALGRSLVDAGVQPGPASGVRSERARAQFASGTAGAYGLDLARIRPTSGSRWASMV